MMNSEYNFSPKKVLDRLFDLLNDERIEKVIDEPIDLAVHTFQLKIKLPITHSEFKRVISAFVHHLYKKGLRLPRHLYGHKAFAEAVYLLESSYLNEGSKGYDGALLDAVGTNMEGFELVLSRLAESIKSAEREKYIIWAFTDNFFNLNWEFQKSIVSFYLIQNKALLPAELCDLDPARLVDCFHKLFINHMSVESMVRQVLNADLHQNNS
jgi:hypothetical protein